MSRGSDKAADPDIDAGPLPRANPDLLGHERAEAAFLEAWHSGRLHHAWLITGAQGVGKATLAYRIARFVLASTLADPEAGGALFGEPPPVTDLRMAADHPVFRRVAASGEADLMTLERAVVKGKLANAISVDQVRGIAGFLHLTASNNGWRIVIIDSADDLNPNAANALLKLLEEPPPRALLLLVANAPAGLLPTIRSRCRRLALAPLDPPTLARFLVRRLPEAGQDERSLLLRLAEGSPGRALRWAEAGGFPLFLALLRAIDQGSPAIQLAFAEMAARSGDPDPFERLAELLPWWLARITRAAARGEKLDEAAPGERQVAERLVARAGLERLVALWENSRTAFARADGLNLDRRQTLIDLLRAFPSST